MCGRFVLQSAFDVLAQIFNLTVVPADLPAGYNIAPGREIAIIVSEGGERRLAACRWGFVPLWAKDLKEGYKMINARAESVAGKPSFRQAFVRHRCLVAADGFYEWKREGGKRSPFYVKLRSGLPFGMAGLYNRWTSPEGEQVCTCTIITTVANETLKTIHDRMPVIVRPDDVGLWLDTAVQDRDMLQSVLRPSPDDEIELYAVTPKVNSPKNDSPENIIRVEDRSR